jgi:transposase
MSEDAPRRMQDLREVFDPLRWIVGIGVHWCLLHNDLPPWAAVYHQIRRWLSAGADGTRSLARSEARTRAAGSSGGHASSASQAIQCGYPENLSPGGWANTDFRASHKSHSM